MDESLEELIERHEGKCRVLYKDSLGVSTIGIGHNCSKPLSDAAMKQILRDDLNDTISDCLHAFPWFVELSRNRQHAILDMCFNLGLPKLQGFQKFLKAMELGDYETAANEMLESLWAKQVKHRALELADMIRGTEPV